MRNYERALNKCAARPGKYKIAKDAKYKFLKGDQVTDDHLAVRRPRDRVLPMVLHRNSVTGPTVWIGWRKCRRRMATFFAAVYSFLRSFFQLMATALSVV